MPHLFRIVLAVIATSWWLSAPADTFPSKPIVLIVPQSIGGTNDIVARVVGPRLGEALHSIVVLENRVGAGGNVGTQAAARAAKDGQTLLMTISSSQAINPVLYRAPGFDPVQDFAPIALVGSVPNVLVVNPGFPARSLDEFLKVVKAAAPGTYQYASAGNGTLNHLLGEMLNSAAGLEIQHIPYKGVAPALTDVIRGQVPMAFASLPSVLGHLKSGRLIALGVSSSRRSSLMPDIPAIGEKLPGYAGTLWIGLFAPRGVPAEVERQLQRAMAKVLAEGRTRTALAEQGVELADDTTPHQLAALLQEDIVRWSRIVKASRARID